MTLSSPLLFPLFISRKWGGDAQGGNIWHGICCASEATPLPGMWCTTSGARKYWVNLGQMNNLLSMVCLGLPYLIYLMWVIPLLLQASQVASPVRNETLPFFFHMPTVSALTRSQS